MAVGSDARKPAVRLRPSRGAVEYPELVAICRSAVDATHGFVAADDLAEIEQELSGAYLPAVTVTVAELDGRPVGFAGTVDNRLEMLFVDDAFRGRGVGTLLLDHAMRVDRVTELDVNEQNPAAVSFYSHRGFHIVSRSECDGAGRPYPLLRMRTLLA